MISKFLTISDYSALFIYLEHLGNDSISTLHAVYGNITKPNHLRIFQTEGSIDCYWRIKWEFQPKSHFIISIRKWISYIILIHERYFIVLFGKIQDNMIPVEVNSILVQFVYQWHECASQWLQGKNLLIQSYVNFNILSPLVTTVEFRH